MDVLSPMREYNSSVTAQTPMPALARTDGRMRSDRLPVKGDSRACAAGMMIPGFDRAVGEMEIGEVVDVHLMPEEAYGMPRPEMIITVEKSIVEGSGDLEVGDKVTLADQLGRPFSATVTAADDKMITFDCNHEMAGKELNFSIELLEAF